jgi:hypothetical protein
MNLDALARVFAGVPDDAPANHAAREGRAADARGADARPDPTAGTIEGEPGARWYGFTVADLQTAAGVDWPVIADRPAAQDALALLLRTRAQRDRGECPDHYTQAAECANCGPVLLWASGPAYLIACPWCTATRPGVAIPRPTAAQFNLAPERTREKQEAKR